MKIEEVQANTGKIELQAKVISKDEPRTFEKSGDEGKVCNIMIKDESGEIKMTLWNEQVELINIGDKIHLKNGWCSEFRGERQVSSGKFGQLDIVEKATNNNDGSNEIFTNDPNMLAQQKVIEEELEKVSEEQASYGSDDSETFDDSDKLEIVEEDVI